MFEIKHLKTLINLAKMGNIKKAADKLFTSQSALSHQIKDLEQRLGAQLFVRNTSPVQFTPQGLLLLQLAKEVLPSINACSKTLKESINNSTQLNLAIACHACFQWLVPVTKNFSQQHSKVNIAFLEQTFAQTSQTLTAPHIDILFTDEKIDDPSFTYQKIGCFEVVAVFAKQQSLPPRSYIKALEISQQTLLTYPISTAHIDIFQLYLNTSLNAKNYRPKAIKQVANSHMILQMVAANMGMAALPDWLVNSLAEQSLVQIKRIGQAGIFKNLYARYLTQSKHLDSIEQLIPQTVSAFNDLYDN